MSADNHRIDGHKLLFHPERVAAWRQAGDDWEQLKRIYPIYMEMSPIGACNHRCTFCALDYLDYTPHRLPVEIMQDRLAEMGAAGVKSVMFAGEGEPLLHKGIHDLAGAACAAGMDIAFTTNGVFLDEAFCERTLPRTSWIKVSCNAGTAETYAAIHRTSPGDFDRVMTNCTRAVAARRASGSQCTLGLQLLLLPENMAEAATLARRCRDEIGADYLVIKPYSQHLHSRTRQYAGLEYETGKTGGALRRLEETLRGLQTAQFRVIFRAEAMARHAQPKPYDTCLATPFFWAYVSAAGELCTCSAHLGDPRFHIGNLLEAGFRELWEGPARRANWELLATMPSSECRINCRMDSINHYLWELRHPAPHVNFI
ncbi:radical SAM protein [Megalodesulfovibrio paquesii]